MHTASIIVNTLSTIVGAMSIQGYVGVLNAQRSQRAQRRATGPRKGERREQEILDATDRLLATTPFAQMTMDDIATQADLSRSALYFYFGSKEEVLTGLHQRIYQEMAETMNPLTDDGAPINEAMATAIQRVGRNWRAHHHALRTFHETAMVSPAFENVWRQRLEQHVTTLTEIIERERGAGRAAPSPPPARAIASSWFWMLESQFYTLFRGEHSRGDEDELVETLNILWLRMIGAR
jgi:AcrR family transcriptional regulator